MVQFLRVWNDFAQIDPMIRQLRSVRLLNATTGGANPPTPEAGASGAEPLVDLDIEAGRISSIRPAAFSDMDAGLTVSPGYVDLQVNGGWGHDLTDSPESLWAVGAGLAELGVTAWMPTLVSANRVTRIEALNVLAAGPPVGWVGAIPLGWHFEGPYLNPNRRGAHRPDALQPVPATMADGRLDNEPLPRVMTIAPELEGAMDAVRALRQAGVVVSVGHTEASPDQVTEAASAGASMATHLFNAMSGISHREPGTAVGLLNSDLWLGLISDGHHVDPEVIRFLWATVGPRLVLVSDGVAAMGGNTDQHRRQNDKSQPGQRTSLAGSEVVVEHGAVRLLDGTLAGAALPLPDAARQFRLFTGCSQADVVRVAATNPALAVNATDRGTIAVGARADLVLTDDTGAVTTTLVGGFPVSAGQH